MNVVVEFDDAVGLRIGHVVGEDHRALDVRRLPQGGAEPRAMEDVVAEHKGDAVVTDELLTDDECLREAVG